MNHEESRLQQQCVAWFRAQYPQYAMLLTHPINEGSGHTTTDRRRQGIHKAEGAVAGVPDLILFMPSEFAEFTYEADSKGKKIPIMGLIKIYHGLGIEMKTKAGRQERSQKDFQKLFEAAGYKYFIVRSFDDFQKVIKEYIGNSPLDRTDSIRTAHAEITKAAEQREREKFYKVIGKK